MFRASAAFLFCLTIIVATLGSAPNDTPPKQFRVTCVMSFSDRPKLQSTLQLDDGVTFSLPGPTPVTQARVKGTHVAVPQPSAMTEGKPTPEIEKIVLGPSASICARSSSADICRLDVTLSETVVDKYDAAAGVLQASSVDTRFVQNLKCGEKLTLKWPSIVNGSSLREIEIIVVPEGS